MAVDGTYKLTADSPIGRQEGYMILATEGGVLKGTLSAMGNTIEFEDGRVSGNAFEFDVKAKTPIGTLEITVQGVVDGDAISGNFVTGYGALPFEGTRAA